MRYTVELTGTSEMRHHSTRLVDPDDEFTAEIAKLTGKRKKTKEDRDEIARLEWHGGLYAKDGAVVFPTVNFKACMWEIAKVRKLGTAMLRALVLLDGVYVPLGYDGPKEIDKLWASPVYRSRAAVGVAGKRVMRVRPQFPSWWLTLNVELLTDVMDGETFVDLVHLAGRAEGLGDGRKLGCGRFSAVVKPA